VLDYEELRIGGYIFEGRLNRRFKPSAGRKTVSRPLPPVSRDDTDIVLRPANRGASICSSDSGDNAKMSQDDIGLTFRRSAELTSWETPVGKHMDMSPSLASEKKATEKTPKVSSPKSPIEKMSPLSVMTPSRALRSLSRENFVPFDSNKLEHKRSRSVTDIQDLYQDASDEFPSEIITATGKVIPVLPLHLQRAGPKLYPSRYDNAHWEDIDYSEDVDEVIVPKSKSSVQLRRRGASGEGASSPPKQGGLRFTKT
jgi:hypothetical protein